MIHYVVSDTYLTTTSHLAANSNYSCMIYWPSYNGSLVRRGQVLLDFDVLDGWDHELSNSDNCDYACPNLTICLCVYLLCRNIAHTTLSKQNDTHYLWCSIKVIF